MNVTTASNGDNGHPLDGLRPPSDGGDRPGPGQRVPPAGGRDAAGRFTAGNRGGPGNPFARHAAAMRQAVCRAVSEEDLQAITRALVEKAKDGDVAAAKLVLGYTAGKPAGAVDPDRLDCQEWRLYQEGGAGPQEVTAMMNSLPVAVACVVARELIPIVAREAGRQILEGAGVPAAVAGGAVGEPGGKPVPPSGDGGNGQGPKQEAATGKRAGEREAAAGRPVAGAGDEPGRGGQPGGARAAVDRYLTEETDWPWLGSSGIGTSG